MKKTILLLSCFVGLQAFAATSIEPGTPYYMRNVATGKYLTAGGWWGTHAVVGDYGLPVTFEDAGSGSYRARTPLGYFQGKDIYRQADKRRSSVVGCKCGWGKGFCFHLSDRRH